jgi:hypothetical protein
MQSNVPTAYIGNPLLLLPLLADHKLPFICEAAVA